MLPYRWQHRVLGFWRSTFPLRNLALAGVADDYSDALRSAVRRASSMKVKCTSSPKPVHGNRPAPAAAAAQQQSTSRRRRPPPSTLRTRLWQTNHVRSQRLLKARKRKSLAQLTELAGEAASSCASKAAPLSQPQPPGPWWAVCWSVPPPWPCPSPTPAAWMALAQRRIATCTFPTSSLEFRSDHSQN